MSRKKLIRRKANEENALIMEPSKEVFKSLRGKWSDVFGNNNPIILELACGRGEYCTGLGKQFENKNYIGVDIKGERLWQAAKNAETIGLENVRFLQIDIGLIEEYFAEDEVDQILIIHPDPQPKKPRKRLTHPAFLAKYNNILRQSGTVYLKTDSDLLYDFTKEILEQNEAKILKKIKKEQEIFGRDKITTNFEAKAIEQGRSIKHLRFLVDVF